MELFLLASTWIIFSCLFLWGWILVCVVLNVKIELNTWRIDELTNKSNQMLISFDICCVIRRKVFEIIVYSNCMNLKIIFNRLSNHFLNWKWKIKHSTSICFCTLRENHNRSIKIQSLLQVLKWSKEIWMYFW